jgi:hypothetical protein
MEDEPMFELPWRRRLIGAALTLLVLGAVSFVYAAWTTDGNGDAYADAGGAQSLSTIDVSASVATLPDALYPGTDGDVLIQVHNPNSFAVIVTRVTSNGTVTASGGIGTCSTTGVSLNSPVTTAIEVPAESNSAETTLSGAVHMSSASENGCQDATFTIPVSLTGVSSGE